MFDDDEIGLVLADDFKEFGVFRALLELGDEGDEEGDLELDLVGVDAVEDAVEFGVVQGGVERFDSFGFDGEELLGRIEIGFLVAFGGEISGQRSSGAGEDAV